MDSSVGKSLLQLVAEADESEPLESQKLRKGVPQGSMGATVNTALKSSNSKLTKEGRCELAVIAVKRAFSQCPNLSLLVYFRNFPMKFMLLRSHNSMFSSSILSSSLLKRVWCRTTVYQCFRSRLCFASHCICST